MLQLFLIDEARADDDHSRAADPGGAPAGSSHPPTDANPSNGEAPMAKAASTSILEMIKRHAEMYREMERLYEIGSDAATSTREYRVLSDAAIELEPIVAYARATTPDEYAAQVKFINRVSLPEDDMIEIAWRLGRSARALGIKRPPRLISWEATGKMSGKQRARHTAQGLAEIDALAAD